MSKSFWDKEKVIGAVPKQDGKSVTRVAITEKDGRTFVDVRKFVRKKGDPEGTFNQHTSSGISLELETREQLHQLTGLLLTAGELLFNEQPSKKRKPRRKKEKEAV